MKTTINILSLLILTLSSFGQTDSTSVKGFYIPQNLSECNQQLNKTLTPKATNRFKKVDENLLNHINGFYIITEWLDTDSSRLTKYFKFYSIEDWQEISLLILLSYHRQLNNKPFDINYESQKLNHKRDSIKIFGENEYKNNIISDNIDGVFIPKDLNSCYFELDKLLNDTIKQEIKNKQTNNDLYDYHMGLGSWIRNNWGLWAGSRLQQYFIHNKVTHPDDMSHIVIVGYNKYLNGKQMEQESLIQEEIARQAEEMNAMIIHQPFALVVKKKFYSKNYKRFLRTKKIRKIEVSIE